MALERDQKDPERRGRDERVVAPGRARRSSSPSRRLWKLIKLQYVERTPIPPEEMQAYAAELEYLPSAFEGAVREVDTVADQRFDKAEEAGGWPNWRAAWPRRKHSLHSLVAQEATLKNERDQLDQVWLTLWAGAPIKVLAPEAMLVWLGTRDDIVTAIGAAARGTASAGYLQG